MKELFFKPIFKIFMFFEKIGMDCYKFFLYIKFKKVMPNSISKYKNIKESQPGEINRCIWVFWYQKLENAPDIVKICIKSIQRNANGNKVIIINKENMLNYVEFPDYIMKKFESGKITITHFSDLLRMSLLSKYGGLWLDSTIYVSKPIPKECFEPKYYSLHSNKFLFDEMTKGKWADFLHGSHKNGNVVNYLKDMFFEYWKNMDKLCNYFFIDFLMSYGYEHLSFFKKDVDAIPENISPYKYCHILRKTFSKKYDEQKYDELLNNAIFFKLTYKIKFKLKTKNSITNYQHFIDDNKQYLN